MDDDGAGDAGADWLDAGPVPEIEPGRGRAVAIGDLRIAVFRTSDGALAAVEDRCPHAGAPLSEGALRDGVIVCSWHGWRFHPVTGTCQNVTWSGSVRAHAVRVVDGRLLVARLGGGTGA